MSTKCFIPILGKRLRFTRLTENGALPEGDDADDAVVVTKGFITVNLSAEIEEGIEIVQRNASGGLCVNEKFSDSFKRFNVEIEFCGVNPSLLTMITNAEPYEDYNGDLAGFTVPEGEITSKFAMELWTGLSSDYDSGPEEAGYFLLPRVAGGVLGDIEIGGEDSITFSLTGSSTEGGNKWGQGPFDVVLGEDVEDGGETVPGEPTVLPTGLDPLDHLLLLLTGVAPPPADCQPTALVGA